MGRLKYAIIVIGLVAVIWLAGYMIFLARVITADIDKPVQTSDAIIVLTGGSKRIDTGIELLRKERAQHLLISGVDRKVSRQDVLATHDAPGKLRTCCITLGHKARDTPGNARESRDWIGQNNIKSLRLVTSHYHIDRAWLEFTRLMPNIRIYKHPVRPADFDARYTRFWLITFEEYNKLLYRIGFHTLTRLGTTTDQEDEVS